MRNSLILMILLVMMSCTSPQVAQQQQRAKYWAGFQNKQESLIKNWDAEFIASPDYQILKAKFPKDPTFSQYSDESKLSDIEKAAFERMQVINQKYEHQMLLLSSEYTPWRNAVIEKIDGLTNVSRLDLYQNKITVGEYLKRRRDLKAQFVKEETEADALHDAAMRSNAVQQAQIDQARSAAAMNMMQSMPQPYQLPTYNNNQQPLMTNCTTFGNQTNCTTR